MYIVLFCENVMSLRLFERVCWLLYFESVNCVYRIWNMSYMQLLCCGNFIKSHV